MRNSSLETGSFRSQKKTIVIAALVTPKSFEKYMICIVIMLILQTNY